VKNKSVDNILNLLEEKLQKNTVQNEVITYHEYLDMVVEKPWITRNTKQLMNDMILLSGVEHTMLPGSSLKQKYNFFEDGEMVDQYIVFGQGPAKSNLVEKISNASKGLESAKRLWILLGPPGSAKSRSMDAIKTALNAYSKSEQGQTYTLLLPTVDQRLKDKSIPGLTETVDKKEVMYLQSPCYETPLQLIPKAERKAFCNNLNAEINQDSLEEFYETYPHYDKSFKITEDGLLSPYAEQVITDFCRDMGDISLIEALKYVKVKRMIYDAKSKTGIGSYTPRDEKSQEAGSLVGNIDYSLLPKFGSESHPLVHDYKGELCVGANGFVEIHEILKLSDKFLYELLFATQDRFFKPEGQSPIPFNGVIIGHTNYHEYNTFMENESFEALRSRTTFIEMPLSINYKEEADIYKNVYSNEIREWTKDKQNFAHVAPHVFELISIIAVMSRMLPSKKGTNVSLLQKALIHAGNAESGVDNNLSQLILEEFEYHNPPEGTFGLDPRFMQNVFEKTEHAQLSEYTANIEKLKQADMEESFISSMSLNNPCITPMDLYVKLEHMVKDIFSNDRAKLDVYMNKVLPKAKKWCIAQVTSDVYSAILKDTNIVENTWKKYCEHVRAFAHNTKVKHEVTLASIEPDEKFMSSVEKFMAIPDRETFRKELSDAISSVGPQHLIAQEPHYESAIKDYVFNNEFRNSESQKLLGWIKSGSSAASVNDAEQNKLNDAVEYLIKEKGYCGKCATNAMVIAASSQSIV
jgi:serine protein kinase